MSHVPIPALHVLYRLLRPFHSGLSGVMQINTLVDRTDQTFDPSATLARFPIELKRLEGFIRRGDIGS